MSLTNTLITNAPSLYSIIPGALLSSKGRAVGPDLSHWKVSYDPEGAKYQADFAITKATEGTTWIDPKVDAIWTGIAKLPIRGLFHYQRSGMSWLSQAKHFHQIASRFDYHFLALDVEGINNKMDDVFFQDSFRIIQWLKDALAGTKKKVMLYTNTSIFRDYLFANWKKYFGIEGVNEAQTVPLWIAQYWTLWSVDKEPSMPPQRASWDIWQVTARANPAEWGAGSLSMDLNAYNGTAASMAAWLELEPTPDPEPQPQPVPTPAPPYPDEPETEPEDWRAIVISETRVNVRAYPKVEAWTRTGLQVEKNDSFRGKLWAGNGFVWLKVSEPAAAPLGGKWIAVRSIDNTLKLIRLERIVPAQPAPAPEPGTTVYYQALHDFELPERYYNDDYDKTTRIRLAAIESPNQGVPEVFRMQTFHGTKLTEPLQRIWYGLNPGMSANAWGALTSSTTAFTNENGTDIRRDYIRGINTDKDLPTFYTLLCGGNLFTGVEMNGMLRVNTIIPAQGVPTLEEVIARRLWFYATIIQKDGEVIRFPQMRNIIPPDVKIPLISSYPVYYPLDKLRKHPAGTDPNKVSPYLFK